MPSENDTANAPLLPDYNPAAAGTVEAIAALHRRGELKLRQRARRKPLSARPLMALAETQRCQGNFAAAIEAYAQMAATRVGEWRKAAWLHAMLRQEQLPFVPPSGVWPAPFVRVENFLPATEHERVCALVLSLEQRFAVARVGEGHRRVDESFRRGLAIDRVGSGELRGILMRRLRTLLPAIPRRLLLDEEHAHGIIGPVDLAAYRHDDFGGAHCDVRPWPYPTPSLNGVYFLHRQPLAFSGGDLLLYDTDIETGASSRLAFSRIEPTSNSLVLLPPHWYHAITRVTSRSGALADARLSACFSVFEDDRSAACTPPPPRGGPLMARWLTTLKPARRATI